MKYNNSRLFILFILISVLILSITAAFGSQPKKVSDTEELKWYGLAESGFEINGLPFYEENQGALNRLPLRAEAVVPKAVWNLAKCPSGARLRFRTNTGSLGIRLSYASLPGMRNMHNFGQAGVDAYVDGQYIGSVAPRREKDVESFLFSGRKAADREITLYFPLYISADIKAVGLEPGAYIKAPEKFALPEPVVYYGTSITQGGCASRAGMSYQAILSRRLNLDFVNLGFSGAGKGEPEVAALVSEIEASCFVLDMTQNNPGADSLRSVYLPFIETLRAKHPDTPIICITAIYGATELPGSSREKYLPAMRGVIRDAVQKRIARGDYNIYLVEGYQLLGPDQGDGLVDGVHPNDLGFQWMADGLEPTLRKVLKL